MTVPAVAVNVAVALIDNGVPVPVKVKTLLPVVKVWLAPTLRLVALIPEPSWTVLLLPVIVTGPKSCLVALLSVKIEVKPLPGGIITTPLFDPLVKVAPLLIVKSP